MKAGCEEMDNEADLRLLARTLYGHKMSQDDVACVLSRADEMGQTQWMLDWLQKNPTAKPSEICRTSMKLLRGLLP